MTGLAALVPISARRVTSLARGRKSCGDFGSCFGSGLFSNEELSALRCCDRSFFVLGALANSADLAMLFELVVKLLLRLTLLVLVETILQLFVELLTLGLLIDELELVALFTWIFILLLLLLVEFWLFV